MVDGVNGRTTVAAVDLVVEVQNTGTDIVMLHLHSTEEILALVHRPNLLPATRIVAVSVLNRHIVRTVSLTINWICNLIYTTYCHCGL